MSAHSKKTVPGHVRRVNAVKQRQYNQKWRLKRARIQATAKELDKLATQLARLPQCAACASANLACRHSPEHRALLERAELVRGELQQLEH